MVQNISKPSGVASKSILRGLLNVSTALANLLEVHAQSVCVQSPSDLQNSNSGKEDSKPIPLQKILGCLDLCTSFSLKMFCLQ